MKRGFVSELPIEELRRLDFLIGESCGQGVLCPPGRLPVPFTGYMTVEREHCERFLRMDFFGQIPILGVESVHSLITYSRRMECYRMWCFATSQEDPMLMKGSFEGSKLTFVSDPMEMVWGIERMRCCFTELDEGVVDYSSELWTIDGYQPYSRATYAFATVAV